MKTVLLASFFALASIAGAQQSTTYNALATQNGVSVYMQRPSIIGDRQYILADVSVTNGLPVSYLITLYFHVNGLTSTETSLVTNTAPTASPTAYTTTTFVLPLEATATQVSIAPISQPVTFEINK